MKKRIVKRAVKRVVWLLYNNHYDGLDHHQSTLGVYATKDDAIRAAITFLLAHKLLPGTENMLILPTGRTDDDYGFYETEVVVCPRDVESNVLDPDPSLFPVDYDRALVTTLNPTDGRWGSSSMPKSTAVVIIKAGELEEKVQLRMYHNKRISEYGQLDHTVANNREQVGQWMDRIEAEAKPEAMIHITHSESVGNLLVARGWRVVPKEELPGASRVTYRGRELMYGLHDGMWTFTGFNQAWQEGEVCYVKGDL